MSVWLIITNPYAYDRSMWLAIEAAKRNSTPLHVVFFICDESIGEMMHDLGEMGFIGAGSFRNLKKSMFSGYRCLAEDVIKRVERKAKDVDLIVEGIVEEPSLAGYILTILTGEYRGQQALEFNSSVPATESKQASSSLGEAALTNSAIKVVVAGSRLFTPKLEKLPKTVVYLEE